MQHKQHIECMFLSPTESVDKDLFYMRRDATRFPIGCNVLVMSQNFAFDMMSRDIKLCRATYNCVARHIIVSRYIDFSRVT